MMGKIQLFLDGAAEPKQPGLASRRRDDLNPEWRFMRRPGRLQGEHPSPLRENGRYEHG